MPDFPRVHRPCDECPFRKDAPLRRFPQEKYESLRCTVQSDTHTPMPWHPLFACHKTPEGLERACASYLALEGYDHIAVRLALHDGRLPISALEPGADWPDLYDSFDDMVDAQDYGGDHEAVQSDDRQA